MNLIAIYKTVQPMKFLTENHNSSSQSLIELNDTQNTQYSPESANDDSVFKVPLSRKPSAFQPYKRTAQLTLLQIR